MQKSAWGRELTQEDAVQVEEEEDEEERRDDAPTAVVGAIAHHLVHFQWTEVTRVAVRKERKNNRQQGRRQLPMKDFDEEVEERKRERKS